MSNDVLRIMRYSCRTVKRPDGWDLRRASEELLLEERSAPLAR
jgi:hypothetical protein